MNKILIVDDERFEREQLCQIIEEEFLHEVQTRTAENGRQAVETAALWTPGIVLMDIEMPGVNGIEAAKRILTQMPSCKLIFVTAYGRGAQGDGSHGRNTERQRLVRQDDAFDDQR